MNINNYRQPLISLVITLILMLIGAIIFQRFKSNQPLTAPEVQIFEEVRSVETSTFQSINVNVKINIDGRINGYEKISIGTEVTGRLIPVEKRYKKGDHFRKGSILFRIYNEDDKYSLYAQNAKLLNAISQMMPDLKLDYPDSFVKWKKYLEEFDVRQDIPPLPQVTDNNEKYFIAGRNIQAQYYTIKSLEDRLGNYSIYAPFNGTILNLYAYPGSIVSPGSPLATIMNTSKYELEVPIPSNHFQYVRPGNKAKLYSEEFEQMWNGAVSRISAQIDQATQSVPVFISVTGKGLKDGMYLRGTLEGSLLENVFEIPTSIIVDQNRVYILQDSILRKKTVEILNRDKRTTLIRGISPIDKLVISGINNLYEGQRALVEN